MIDASTDIGLNEPGVRNYDDVSEILPFDQMLRTAWHSRPTASRFRWRGPRASPPLARPGGGTISGEIPVMNLDGWTWEEATLRPAAGLAFNFPGPQADGEAVAAAVEERPADRARSDEDAEPAARAGACLCEAAGDPPGGLDLEPFLPVLDRRQALYVSPPPNRASAMRWPGPRSRTCVSFCRRRRRATGRRTAQAARRPGHPLEHPVVAAAGRRVPRLPYRLLACWPKLVFRSRSRAAGSSSRATSRSRRAAPSAGDSRAMTRSRR